MKFIKKHWPWVLLALVIIYLLFKPKAKTATPSIVSQVNSIAAAEAAAFNGD